MLAIQSHNFYFTEPGIQDHTFTFSSRIKDYGAALQGFDLNYGEDDHEVQALGAEITNVELRNEETELYVEVKLTLHDHDKAIGGGHKGQGQIDIVAFADVKS